MPDVFMKKEIFKSLEESARIGALSEKERMPYEHSLKVYRDNYAIAQTERQQGRAEWRAEWRAEEKFETVRNMRRPGLDNDVISKVTGLSIDEIMNIN